MKNLFHRVFYFFDSSFSFCILEWIIIVITVAFSPFLLHVNLQKSLWNVDADKTGPYLINTGLKPSIDWF